MKISVIIPTYKGADVICRAVNSVLGQEYSEEFEVIVVDDNSPESRDRRQTELAMNVFADDKRVIYIKHEYNKMVLQLEIQDLDILLVNIYAFLMMTIFFFLINLECRHNIWMNIPNLELHIHGELILTMRLRSVLKQGIYLKKS